MEFKEEFTMGSFSILNNIAGINSQNQLNINNVNLHRTLSRLASGRRINSGADDAAGLQIADSLRANVMALNQAVRNANDGISVCQIADGALQEITNLLTRNVTLAEESATEIVDLAGRKALNKEMDAIKKEITRIAEDTNFNGLKLFAGTDALADSKLSVFVGDLTNMSMVDVSFGSILSGGTGFDTDDLNAADLLDETNAQATLTVLKDALNDIAIMRGNLGAGMNRLQAAVAVIQAQSQNTLAAESAMRDANMAEEISNLTKFQILSQSGIAALAQANSQSQSVLQLLQ